MTEPARFALAIHGGAGNIRRDSSELPEMRQELFDCLGEGQRLLEAGETALDVVEHVVRRLEVHPMFNAGRGAVLTSEGRVELDASIMNGAKREAGAIGAVSNLLHAVTLARGVMDHGDHVLLVGEGALRFAREQGFESVEMDSLLTAKRQQQLERAKQRRRVSLDHDEPNEDGDGRGTVGAVALDTARHLAAATSTGGLTNQLPGRVGDSAIIGAGTWADDETAAVSATGHGEAFIRAAVAHEVDAGMRLNGLALMEAARQALARATVCGGSGGLIAVDGDGEIVMPMTASGMFRGCVRHDREPWVGVFDDD